VKRRTFIAGLGSAAAWPLTARAQRPAMPVLVLVSLGSADSFAGYVAAFRKGLGETGYVEGQNVMVETHYLEGQYDRLQALMADLVRRRVAVIATPDQMAAAIAAKAATATIPIVFGIGDPRHRAENPCPQRQHEPRDRCGIFLHCARSPRCPLRCTRHILARDTLPA
jgi:putative ABC transport system substrate-binding protein